ncbi:MAG: hypothetical protein U0V64_02445 [Cyclobacteriaceae bacterium]
MPWARGFANDAKAHNIRVLRGDQVFLVDFSTLAGYQAGNIAMQSGDVVYVEPIRRPLVEGLRDYTVFFSMFVSLGTLLYLINASNERDESSGQCARAEVLDLDKLLDGGSQALDLHCCVFIASNLSAYLVIRYTKDVFQSESEIKLDTKTEAAELGIKAVVTEDNVAVISGEIEQIRSRVNSFNAWLTL